MEVINACQGDDDIVELGEEHNPLVIPRSNRSRARRQGKTFSKSRSTIIKCE